MKTQSILLVALSISMIGFAQKDEIKEANKAIKSGDAAAAKATLENVINTIDGADPKLQAQYYSILGDANRQLSDFDGAIKAYNKLIDVEEASGKDKYTTYAKASLVQITGELVNAAVDDNGKKNFSEAATKLYQAYTLSPKDTIYLYYAASSAVNGGSDNYDQAIEYYNQLKNLNYDGSEIEYSAVEVATGETLTLDAQTYELYKKTNAYKDFKEEKTPSKRAEIVKNIALIYQEQGKNNKALAAYEDAIADNPNDVNLILNKANLYYTIGDKDKFKELMAKASAMAPDNPDLLYNIGVINMEQGNMTEARAAYKKALSIDPNYINALLNLSTTYVNEGNELVDEMNTLGTSSAETKKYDALKAKRDNLFEEGAEVLEAALKSRPDNIQILEQLKNIYAALGDTNNFTRIKKLIEE